MIGTAVKNGYTKVVVVLLKIDILKAWNDWYLDL